MKMNPHESIAKILYKKLLDCSVNDKLISFLMQKASLNFSHDNLIQKLPDNWNVGSVENISGEVQWASLLDINVADQKKEKKASHQGLAVNDVNIPKCRENWEIEVIEIAHEVPADRERKRKNESTEAKHRDVKLLLPGDDVSYSVLCILPRCDNDNQNERVIKKRKRICVKNLKHKLQEFEDELKMAKEENTDSQMDDILKYQIDGITPAIQEISKEKEDIVVEYVQIKKNLKPMKVYAKYLVPNYQLAIFCKRCKRLRHSTKENSTKEDSAKEE